MSQSAGVACSPHLVNFQTPVDNTWAVRLWFPVGPYVMMGWLFYIMYWLLVSVLCFILLLMDVFCSIVLEIKLWFILLVHNFKHTFQCFFDLWRVVDVDCVFLSLLILCFYRFSYFIFSKLSDNKSVSNLIRLYTLHITRFFYIVFSLIVDMEITVKWFLPFILFIALYSFCI